MDKLENVDGTSMKQPVLREMYPRLRGTLNEEFQKATPECR